MSFLAPKALGELGSSARASKASPPVTSSSSPGRRPTAALQRAVPFEGGVCDSGEPCDEVSQTTTAGKSSLSYDAATDTYTNVWKTVRKWAGWRELTVGLYDGTTQRLTFHFSR